MFNVGEKKKKKAKKEENNEKAAWIDGISLLWRETLTKAKMA